MRFEVIVAATPGDAFAAVGDFGQIQHWDPFVEVGERIVGDHLAVGSRYRLTTPRGMMLVYEVVEADVPRMIVYRGGTRRVTSTDRIEVEPHESGSRVMIDSRLEFSGWLRLVGPVVEAGVWLGGRLRSLPAMRRHLGTPEAPPV